MKSWIPRGACALLAASAFTGPVELGRGCPPTAGVTACAIPFVPDGDAGLAAGSPEMAIALMLEGFASRSWRRYVHAMAEDFVFTSDDPDHVARYPHGMTRDDERAFAQHLFQGGGRGPGGAPLPIATGVELVAGHIVAMAAEAGATRRVVHVLSSRITLEDGSVMDVGGTLNTMDLVLTEAGWRVCRWHESLWTPDPSSATANAATGGEYVTLPRHP